MNRLRWDGRRGVVESLYVRMTILTPPPLPFAFYELDYAPGACLIVRRSPHDRMDDMRPDEIAACRALLDNMDAGPPDLEPDR